MDGITPVAARHLVCLHVPSAGVRGARPGWRYSWWTQQPAAAELGAGRETIEEALDRAVEIMAERGVGGLSIMEMARRMGVQGPSLYKYFPSLHAVYDALFARGVTDIAAAIGEATRSAPEGRQRLREGVRASVRW